MQANYSSINQGDIVIVNLVFTDFSSTKRRPVLVISNTTYNQNSGNVIVLSISSAQIGSKFDSELLQKDLIEGKLKLTSKILVDYPSTVSKAILSEKIARISSEKLKEVKQKMIELYQIYT